MHDYIEAEHIGQSTNTTCGKEFPECPVSLYNLFRAHESSNEIPEDDEREENESQESETYEQVEMETSPLTNNPQLKANVVFLEKLINSVEN